MFKIFKFLVSAKNNEIHPAPIFYKMIRYFKKYWSINKIINLMGKTLLLVLEKIGRGYTKYYGEFGYELISVIPYAYWMYLHGKLRKTKSTRDTRSLYYFSPRHEEVDIKRHHVIPNIFPVSNVHVPQLNVSKWVPPPYRDVYQNRRFTWDKPTCVICNKFNVEWSSRPKNYFSPEILSQIFLLLMNKYQIIYNRPLAKDVVQDHSPNLAFGDYKMLREKFPKIITMHAIAENNKDLSFNTIQLMVYSNSNNFISVQGGNAVLVSYFGGTNIIYAAEGKELEVESYQNWYHKFSGCKIVHVNNYGDLISEIRKRYL